MASSGVQAPARTPRLAVEKVAAVLAACAEPAMQAKLSKVGTEPRLLGRVEFDRFVTAENTKWSEVVRISGVKLE